MCIIKNANKNRKIDGKLYITYLRPPQGKVLLIIPLRLNPIHFCWIKTSSTNIVPIRRKLSIIRKGGDIWLFITQVPKVL